MIRWLLDLFSVWRQPPHLFDSDFLSSDSFSDRIPLDAECPDTQPTRPGALDSLEDAMKTAVLAMVILALTGCATLKGVEISDEERAACEASGCSVWTRAELENLVREAMRRGYLAGKKSI